MVYMNWIVERLNAISEYFYDLYLETSYWYPPFDALSGFFWRLCYGFNKLAWHFSSFFSWLLTKFEEIGDTLSLNAIQSYFQYWLDRAEWAWSWVSDAFQNVWYVVDDWWSSIQYTVLAWIDDAKSYADSLVAGFNTWLASLQSSWDAFKGRIPTIDGVIAWWNNWTGNVLSTINTWWTGKVLEVQGLINTAFTIREDYWRGWQDWRDKVTEFFSDPEDWLYKAADRIIERFW